MFIQPVCGDEGGGHITGEGLCGRGARSQGTGMFMNWLCVAEVRLSLAQTASGFSLKV